MPVPFSPAQQKHHQLTPPLQKPRGLAAPGSKLEHSQSPSSPLSPSPLPPPPMIGASSNCFTCGCCSLVLVLVLQSMPLPTIRAISSGAGSLSRLYCHKLPVLIRAMVASWVRRWGRDTLTGCRNSNGQGMGGGGGNMKQQCPTHTRKEPAGQIDRQGYDAAAWIQQDLHAASSTYNCNTGMKSSSACARVC